MLGSLRMNVDQAVDALLAVASAIFPSDSGGTPNPETNSKNLRGAVEDILQARQIPLDRKMNDKATSPSTACKVWVLCRYPSSEMTSFQGYLCSHVSQSQPP